MKTLKLLIDISTLNLSEEDKKVSPIVLASRVIGNVLYNYSQQVSRGLLKSDRTTFYAISDILSVAEKENKEEIELADEFVGFIRKCFRETKLNPSELLRKVEEQIDEIKDR